MKLFDKRSEIMDTVAGLILDNSKQDFDVESAIKLSLLQWNHVKDKSLPSTEFKGWDVGCETPLRSLNFYDFFAGAQDYKDQRVKSLTDELAYNVNDQQQVVREASSFYDFGANYIAKIDELESQRSKIVESLGMLGVDPLTRKVSFNIDPHECKVAGNMKELATFIQNSLLTSGDQYSNSLSVNVADVPINESGDHFETVIECYVADKGMGTIVKDITEIMNTHNDRFISLGDKVTANANVEQVVPTLPSLMDHEQLLKQAKLDGLDVTTREDLRKPLSAEDAFSQMSM